MLSELYQIKDRIPPSLLAACDLHEWLVAPGVTGVKQYAIAKMDSKGNIVKVEKVDRSTFGEKMIVGKDNHNRAFFAAIKGFKGRKLNRFFAFAEELRGLIPDKKHPAHVLLSRLLEWSEEPEEFQQELVAHLEPICDEKKKVEDFGVIFENHQPPKKGASGLLHTPDSYASLSDALSKSLLGKGEIIVDPYGVEGTVSTSPWKNFYPRGVKSISAYQNNPDTPAHNSYGLGGSDKFPVTEQSKAEISKVLKALLSERARGKLCQVIKMGRGDNRHPFINCVVPLLDDGELDEKVASLCYMDDPTGEEDERRVLDEGAAILNAIRAKAKKKPDSDFIMLAILKKGDWPPRVMSNWRISYDDLADRLEFWLEAMKDTISINYYGKDDEGNAKVSYQSRSVPILRIAEVMNMGWTPGCGVSPDGTMVKNYGSNIGLYEFAPHEFLDAWLWGNDRIVDRALSVFGRHHAYLLLDMRARVRAKESWCMYDCRKDILFFPSLLSFLFKMKGKSMDSIKSSVPYLLGEALGSADRLHVVWCEREKKGRLPAKLVGSSFASSFLSSSRMDRLWHQFVRQSNVFRSWAKMKKGNKKPEQDRELIFPYLKLVKACRLISDNGGIPRKFNDEDKAAFALGFYSVY